MNSGALLYWPLLRYNDLNRRNGTLPQEERYYYDVNNDRVVQFSAIPPGNKISNNLFIFGDRATINSIYRQWNRGEIPKRKDNLADQSKIAAGEIEIQLLNIHPDKWYLVPRLLKAAYKKFDSLKKGPYWILSDIRIGAADRSIVSADNYVWAELHAFFPADGATSYSCLVFVNYETEKAKITSFGAAADDRLQESFEYQQTNPAAMRAISFINPADLDAVIARVQL